MKVEYNEIKDLIINGFCMENCKEEIQDYDCPNHGCPAWKTIAFCIDNFLRNG